jgi:transcriptional regulator with XRE-family HTH domain
MLDWAAIGTRVRKLRKATGFSQLVVATESGVPRGTLGRIENGTGKKQVGIKPLVELADYFKVPLDYLLCRSVPPGGPLVDKFVDDPDELAWLALWGSWDDGERAAALKMLKPGVGRRKTS